MDPSGSSASGSNGRQKRVLPSRTRRGGPGVGSCDTDIMILEHQKRRFETEAIIPAGTPFLLTTNSEVFSSAGGPAESSVTTVTNERYFDRPDVLKAYREQLTIQTPSFVYVADNPSVGGRFRPRGPEDAQVDTSDAAYERRHRKYETFEKRQRLREKEKLKHEQYKLKERIEQLRVMDASAFLTLPASHFSSAPRVSDEYAEDDSSSMLAAHINGSSTYHEGERRRKEMLDIAVGLEERYRVLLPPERLRKLQSQSAASREHMSPIPVPVPVLATFRHTDSDAPESEREEDYIGGHYDRKQEKLRIKFRFGGSASHSPAPTTASRTSRRSARASVPPGQKPARRRSSRVYGASRSPTPSTSPTKFADSSQLTAYTTSESPSPDVRQQEVEEPEKESSPPVSDAPRSVVSSDLKPETAVGGRGSRSPSHAHTLPPLTPPQRLSPLPYTRPAPAPEVNPANLEQEEPMQESTPPKEHPPVSTAHSGDLLIDVDKESSPSPMPLQPNFESPHAEPPRRNASPPLKPDEIEIELPARSPIVARPTEEGSRLLELANAVQAITAASPPTKRQKTRYRELSKSREPSLPPLQLVAEPEHRMTPVSPGFAFTPKEAPLSNGEAMALPPSPLAPSAGPSVISDAALVSISAASGKRRYKKKSVPYRSSDTGEQMHTRSLLLIAGIRGSLRQVQRHQTAFGVKVPEDISDVRDFQLPAEFWPEEELMKHYVYYGLEVPEQKVFGTVDAEDTRSPK